MNTRRQFLKKSVSATLLMGLPYSAFSTNKPNDTVITILHTNDVHSHIDPFGPNAGRNSNKGGVARRATLVSKIRSENPNTLLFDAGDIFQGTPYFNYYGGELEFKLMSMLKYDAATLGNHDFDNGLGGLLQQLPFAKFPFISSNYDFKNTLLDGYTKPYKVFEKGPIKIGVFGLGIKLEGLVTQVNYGETQYLDPIETAQEYSRILKYDKKCDLIICLSHLGYYYKKHPHIISDINLAKATKDIDLIIGGHTHTFLPKPTVITNKDKKDVLVNQVGCYGLYLGKIDFHFSQQQKNTTQARALII